MNPIHVAKSGVPITRRAVVTKETRHFICATGIADVESHTSLLNSVDETAIADGGKKVPPTLSTEVGTSATLPQG